MILFNSQTCSAIHSGYGGKDLSLMNRLISKNKMSDRVKRYAVNAKLAQPPAKAGLLSITLDNEL